MASGKASDCVFGYVQSTEKGPSANLRDACRHCGRTKAAHEKVVEKLELPSNIQAEEFLTLAGYKNTTFYELARVVLTRYIEWKKQQLSQ